MKKIILLSVLAFVMLGFNVQAQTGRTYEQSQYASKLKDVVITPTVKPDNPRDGELIVNIVDGKLEYYFQGTWYDLTKSAMQPSDSLPTGLELITENGKSGWRFIGRNPLLFGNIGRDAVDLSRSVSPSTTSGALAKYSLAAGEGVSVQSPYSVIIGTNSGIYTTGENSTTSFHNIILGGITDSISESKMCATFNSYNGIIDSSEYSAMVNGRGLIKNSDYGTIIGCNGILSNTDHSAIISSSNITLTGDHAVAIGINSQSTAIPDTLTQDNTVFMYRISLIPKILYSGETPADEGTIYYDKTAHKLKCWDGTSWVSLW